MSKNAMPTDDLGLDAGLLALNDQQPHLPATDTFGPQPEQGLSDEFVANMGWTDMSLDRLRYLMDKPAPGPGYLDKLRAYIELREQSEQITATPAPQPEQGLTLTDEQVQLIAHHAEQGHEFYRPTDFDCDCGICGFCCSGTLPMPVDQLARDLLTTRAQLSQRDAALAEAEALADRWESQAEEIRGNYCDARGQWSSPHAHRRSENFALSADALRQALAKAQDGQQGVSRDR